MKPIIQLCLWWQPENVNTLYNKIQNKKQGFFILFYETSLFDDNQKTNITMLIIFIFSIQFYVYMYKRGISICSLRQVLKTYIFLKMKWFFISVLIWKKGLDKESWIIVFHVSNIIHKHLLQTNLFHISSSHHMYISFLLSKRK